MAPGDVLANKATWVCNGTDRTVHYRTVILDPNSDDYDGDGVLNDADRCPGGTQGPSAYPFQDIDGDGCKMHEDLDDDGDGVLDDQDACPLLSSASTTQDCNYLTDNFTTPAQGVVSTVSISATNIGVMGPTETCSGDSWTWWVDDALTDNTDYYFPIANNQRVRVGSTVVVRFTVSNLSVEGCDQELNDGYEYHTIRVTE